MQKNEISNKVIEFFKRNPDQITYLIPPSSLEIIKNNYENSKEKKIPERKRTDEEQIIKLLNELGIPRNIKGYYYLRKAIKIAIDNLNVSMTKQLYPSIAKEFNVTASKVERAIRHAIEVAWKRTRQETIEEIFGCSFSSEKGKPTNSEFIFIIADEIKMME